MTNLVWFRRDLRLGDHPALQAAADRGPVVGLVVLDPQLWDYSAPGRLGWYAASVRALAESMGGSLVLRWGDPTQVVPAVVSEVKADAVFVTAEPHPPGAQRDAVVRSQVGADRWREVGTPYAVDPGVIRTGSGQPYQVFTPFARAWRAHGWPAAWPQPEVTWEVVPSDPGARERVQAAIDSCPIDLPEPGELGALNRWRAIRNTITSDYATDRDRPDLDATSRMSPYLKVGAVHPRTLLADLAAADGPVAADCDRESVTRFIDELGWREFYADVTAHHPDSLTRDLRPVWSRLSYDEPGPGFEAWRAGRTGYPLVDAGIRQLVATGWMHNRVRMVVASFLVKDLHLWWVHGARFFDAHLIDADAASNAQGWQWAAGTGTDAAPYHRIFNPTTQAERFDPAGDYVRRWVPELAHLPGAAVHQPWARPGGYAHGYPERIVDHATERRESLRRAQLARAATET